MAEAQSQQGGTLFDISFPNHVVSVLARGGADFSRGCGGVRGLACPPSPGIAPTPHSGQFPHEGQSPPPAPGPDLAVPGLPKSTQPPASHSADLHAPSGETDRVHLGPGLPWSAPLPGGAGPGHRGQQGGGHSVPLGGGSGSAAPAPKWVLTSPAVCRESFPPGSLGLPSALSGLFLVFKSWNPSAQVGARQYHTPDSRRTPPLPGTGGRRSSQGPQISAFTDFRG